MTTANDTSAPVTLPICGTVETPVWRVHRYTDSLLITSLSLAGRRGKRCEQWSFEFGYLATGRESRMEAAIPSVLALVADAAPVSTMALLMTELTVTLDARVTERTLRGVDVAPCAPDTRVEIEGEALSLTIEPGGFRAACKRDLANRPSAYGNSKADAKRLARWARANVAKVEVMTFREFVTAASELVEVSEYCGND